MPNQPDNLLNTVLTDKRLRERLESMPSDEKTIAVSANGHPVRLTHPEFDFDSAVDHTETINLPVSPPSSATGRERREFEGFVPVRRVAALRDAGAQRRSDVEYRLVGQLGSGGTGIVYQAHQRAIDREVAIKVLRTELAGDGQARSRFLTEARVIGALDHPNVIALHELCLDENGGLFYSMKRVDGTSWAEQIATMSRTENIEILLRVADAIRYAHSRGLVHRDLKPENVMLGRFGEVLLADWGLAISHGPEESSDRQTDSAIGGTPAYMAPELANGDQSEISFHTDVYLLGAILYQILSGHPPHHGRSLLDCIRAAANNEIQPTEVTGELMGIAIKAMSTLPADRYTTVDALIAAIHAERTHEQSVRLVKRAEQASQPSADDNHYEGYRLADALLREAIEIWPENQPAAAALKTLRLSFARNAADRGDLDLAITLFEIVGDDASNEAAEIRRRREERDNSAQSSAKYSTLFTQSPEAGLLIRFATGEIVEANIAFSELLGYPAAEIVGRVVADLNVWACTHRRAEFVEQLKQVGRVDNFETPFFHRDGRRIDVLISARMTTVDGDEMLVSTIRDISQRKAAENELRRSQQRLRELQQMGQLGSWSYEIQSGEISWSDETFRLVGRDPQLGPPGFEEYLDSIHPDDRERLHQAVQSTIENATAYDVRIRQRFGDGIYHHVIARGQPVLGDDNQPIELYGVILPIANTASAHEVPTSASPAGDRLPPG